MNSCESDLEKVKELREQAEQLANSKLDTLDFNSLSKEEIQKQLHELNVHQIELKLQNEELQTTQEELELSRAKYFELYNNAPVGYITLNDKEMIVEANLLFCNLLAYPRKDIINRLFSNHIIPDDQDIYYKFTKQFKKSDSKESCELRLVTKNLKQFYASIAATREYIEGTDEFIYYFVVTDISERKLQELMKNAQYRLLQTLIDSPEDIIFSLDTNYRYTAFNNNHKEEMRKIWKADISVGDRILEYMSIPEFVDQAKQSMDRTLQGERFTEVIHQSDQNKYYEMDWNPVYGDDSKIVGLTAFVRDITTRKMAEEIIKNNNVFLEQKVKERTSELELSKNELEAFSASVAHDLTSPLRSIDGFSQILLEDYDMVLDDAAKLLLKRIRKSAIKMDEIITSLLHLAHITQSELYQAPIEMKRLVSNVWEEIQRETKGATSLNLTELPDAIGDINLVKIVWENLLSNALKFTLKMPLRMITITGVVKEQFAEYCVADTGAGFDMEYYSQLFETFHRLHSDQEFAGNGIGLSIVQRIVNKHGGKIWATSEVNKGAKFYFTLPVIS